MFTTGMLRYRPIEQNIQKYNFQIIVSFTSEERFVNTSKIVWVGAPDGAPW